MKTKNIILTVAFSLISLFGFSQTSIGPMIGYNSAEILEGVYSLGYHYSTDIKRSKKGYIWNSLNFGFRGNQSINKWLNITISSKYMQKTIFYKWRYIDLKYSIINSDLLINLELINNFNVGFGVNHSRHFNSTLDGILYYSSYPIETHFKSQDNLFGFMISSSYKYHDLVFEFRYGINNNLKEQDVLIKSSKYYEFSMSYMFEVFGKKE